MPKRMTPEQRAQRREESLARQRAWRVRRSEFRKAEEAGVQEIARQFAPQLQALADEQSALDKEWEEQDRRHQKEQTELHERHVREIEAMRTRREVNKQKSRPVFDEHRRALTAHEASLYTRFPDLKGSALWSSASWRPPGKADE